ncbi:hypothetical protein LX32DRAFT_435699 [Colletotrichum zoysiae]|uniref:Uncharacterized protein n=1 Tax=Colletotrichum zoysiae TaxID=1216348 RepID=A0AAD9HFV5_9PEZI|nr:hypothetical protein LX32DRAFT_435699 [Colletotrichum zoysiae]
MDDGIVGWLSRALEVRQGKARPGQAGGRKARQQERGGANTCSFPVRMAHVRVARVAERYLSTCLSHYIVHTAGTNTQHTLLLGRREETESEQEGRRKKEGWSDRGDPVCAEWEGGGFQEKKEKEEEGGATTGGVLARGNGKPENGGRDRTERNGGRTAGLAADERECVTAAAAAAADTSGCLVPSLLSSHAKSGTDTDAAEAEVDAAMQMLMQMLMLMLMLMLEWVADAGCSGTGSAL